LEIHVPGFEVSIDTSSLLKMGKFEVLRLPVGTLKQTNSIDGSDMFYTRMIAM
jgi:hypothetical protein